MTGLNVNNRHGTSLECQSLHPGQGRRCGQLQQGGGPRKNSKIRLKFIDFVIGGSGCERHMEPPDVRSEDMKV